MQRHVRQWIFVGTGCLTLAGLGLLGPFGVVAQQSGAQPKQAEAGAAQTPGNLVLVFPTGDRATGNLMIEAATPAEVPVGQTYQYTIRVSNISRNLILEDVKIHQTTPEGLSIESSEPKAEAREGEEAGTTWAIDRLAPGESKSFKVSALSDKEGAMAGCLRAEYKPSLCLTTRFIKPALELTKAAPERIDICEPLTIRYAVRNSGSGAARNVRITDELPEGLTLNDGGRNIQFTVDELAAGQSRDFQVQVTPAETGTYGSRANAEAADDLTARSNRTQTEVIASSLAVTMTGPKAQYVNQPMTYQVEVRNEGKAPAPGARLQVQVDESARLLRVSRSDPGNADPNQSGRTVSWDLGTLEPDQSRVVSFTTVAGRQVQLEHTAQATSACAREDIAKAATATVAAQTEILTFPALLLAMVDQNDPVQVGENEVYTVTVVNQGSGEDHNVKLVVELPEQFEYINATGDTEAQVDGRSITLGPIESLAPRARATWKLEVKANQPGDVRTRVELSSDYLTDPVSSTEPTRLIGTSSENRSEPAKVESKDQGKAQSKDQGKAQSKDQGNAQPKDQSKDQGKAQPKDQ